MMSALRLQGAGWDKALHIPSGFCSILSETPWTDAIIVGDEFSIWGWAESPEIAQALVIDEVMARARAKGVVEDARSVKRVTKGLV